MGVGGIANRPSQVKWAQISCTGQKLFFLIHEWVRHIILGKFIFDKMIINYNIIYEKNIVFSISIGCLDFGATAYLQLKGNQFLPKLWL